MQQQKEERQKRLEEKRREDFMKKREEAEMRREEGELQRQERERMKVEKEREREWRRAALEKERADVDLMAGGEEKLEKEVALWLKEVKFPLAFVFVADRCLISPPPFPPIPKYRLEIQHRN